jgi:hypothetical protein
MLQPDGAGSFELASSIGMLLALTGELLDLRTMNLNSLGVDTLGRFVLGAVTLQPLPVTAEGSKVAPQCGSIGLDFRLSGFELLKRISRLISGVDQLPQKLLITYRRGKDL